MSVRSNSKRGQRVGNPGDPTLRTSDPSIIDEFRATPGSQWIPRVRTLPPDTFGWISGRIHRGLRFGVAARIEDARHRILLVRMNPQTAWTSNWVTPGGGAEPGETPRAAILREIEEETGVRTGKPMLWKVYHETLRSSNGRSVDWDFLQYLARWKSGRPHSLVPDEVREARWFARLPKNMEFREDWLHRRVGRHLLPPRG